MHSGYYIYTETSGRSGNVSARILSAPMTIDDVGKCLQFWYHMYGSTIGTLNVYTKVNGGLISFGFVLVFVFVYP